MSTHPRPMSPHLQVYRPQITSVTSITHRITGVLLAAGFLLLVYWLQAVASGPEAFLAANEFFRSFIGRVLMFGVGFSFFYHLCNGIRHLAWDTGRGLEIEAARKSGVLVIVAGFVLTALFYLFAYGVFGGAA
ncbi:MAG: succinate dehydrogenase, cytochrome b556 subunit [Gammaproteobacteria bacterium]